MIRLRVNLIPDITNAEIEQMLQVLQPVYGVPAGRDAYGCEEFEFFDIDTTGVNRWSHSFVPGELGQQRYFPWRNGYAALIPSYHTYAFHGFFKPSLAEVLAAIRAKVENWEEARYFWVKLPHGDNRDILGNYHAAHIYLFEKDWGK